MLKEKIQKIKDIFILKQGENNKKKIENLVVFIVILIITIIIINTIWKSDKNNKEEGKINTDTSKVLAKIDTNEENEQIYNLEERLEEILGKIVGVGKVKVLLTYAKSSTTVAMYNEDSTKSDTEETDSGGGSRKIAQVSTKKEVIYEEVNGKKVPVVQNTINPQIEGAIITAVGANNANVKSNIIQAVEAATRSCNSQNSSF